MGDLKTSWAARLSVISDEVAQDLPAIAAFVRQFGLDGIELRSALGRPFKDLTAWDVAEIGRVAAGEGWKIHGCATPVFKCDWDDAAALREHRRIFDRSIEVAHHLGSRLLRVFTFLRKPAALTAQGAARIAEQLLPLCERAAAAGMRLGIENEASCTVASAEELSLLFRHLRHPAAGIIWDPCNVLYVPGIGQVDLAADFASLAPLVLHVHVKDARTGPQGMEAAVVGEGEVGWPAQLRSFRAAGYGGLLSLETHWRRKALEEKELHLPAGYVFSAGGDEASRIGMKCLVDLCADC